MSTSDPTLDFHTIKQAFEDQPLFEDKTWRISPEPWPITPRQLKEIEAIGQACLEFYQAVETLYLRSTQGKRILRNKDLQTPWVAEYYDRGKPQALIDHARSKRLRGAMPFVIRPDLLLTDDGFALTEIDSVPGGIGLTAFLNKLYERSGRQIIGRKEQMVEAFYKALSAHAPDQRLPMITILVSDEAATYRPEMQWLAENLQRRGKRVYCMHPKDVMPLGETLCADMGGNPEQINIIYRFWELFDMANVPVAEYILEAWEESELAVSPPMRHFQEEKLSLALFHHHLLQDFWQENLSRKSLKLLRRIVPRSWVMDPVELPPPAVLDAPYVGGHPINNWEQLAEATQKERNLILKLSGFHEQAWGARSVLFGSDASRADWAQGIQDALKISRHNLFVLQEYRKPRRLRHPVYADPENLHEMEGRLRLCPYYFVQGDQSELGGILATFCPADKKIIHGMRDAAMLPCCLAEE